VAHFDRLTLVGDDSGRAFSLAAWQRWSLANIWGWRYREDDRRRVRLAVLLGARAGLRRAEIRGLHQRDISETHLTVTGKGGKTRRIPIHPDLRGPLRAVEGWAFPSSQRPGEHLSSQRMAEIIDSAIGPWTAHSLRRRFATSAYDGSGDIRAVQELLGHASPTTTSLYVRANESRMEAAVLAVA
jgi:integrase